MLHQDFWDGLHAIVLRLPVVTTLVATFFCWQLASRYRAKGGGPHLLWWGIGMLTYGLGTLTESITSIFGWHPLVFRVWYVAGAFLGGYPLAQGSIYLLMSRRFANRSAWIVSSLIAAGAVAVFLAPLDLSLVETHRLSGKVIEWRWVRLISPFINLYSLVFLAGGAVLSALRFRREHELRDRYVGNVLIAVGAILPGIGGTMTRLGYVEVLYVTELLGLLLIYAGYRRCIATPPPKTSNFEGTTMRTLEKIHGATTAALFCLSLVLCVPSTARAEDAAEAETDADAEAKPSFFATTTVTATGTETDAFELPISVSVIDNLEERSENTAADLLLTEPGVDVNGVGANQTRPIIRGQRGLRVLLLEDGLSLNNPRRQTDFGEVSGLVALDRVEKVEVVRGPSAVLYGSGAIGGVLNLVTRVPSYSQGNLLNGVLSLRSSSVDDQEKAGLNVNGRWNKLAYSIDASYRDVGDYDVPSGAFGEVRLPDDVTIFDSGVQDDSLAAYIGYRFSDRHAIFVRSSRYRAGETGFGFTDPALLDPNFDGTQTRIFYPFQDFDRLTLGYTGSGLDTPWADTAEVKLYDQSNERELAFDAFINIGPIFPGAPDSSVDLDTLNFTDLDTTGARGELTKVLGGKHLLTYGAEYIIDDSFNTDFSSQVVTLRFGPGFEFVDTDINNVANSPNAENISYATFAQGELFLTDRLKAIAGARYQNVETNAKVTPGRDTTGLDFADDAFVGSVQLLYSVTDELKLMGSYATAFRAPSIVERLFQGVTPEGSGFQLLNRDLVSEESDNYDIGFKYRRKQAYLDVVYFENKIDNGVIQYFLNDDEIAALPPGIRQMIDNLGLAFVVQQRNIDKLKINGLEAAVGYRFKNGFEVAANYTHLNSRRVDSDNPPTADTPSDKYNLVLEYAPFGARYRFTYRLRHNSEENAVVSPGDPVPVVGETLPAFTVQTLTGFVTVLERGTWRHDVGLTIDNLADELYSEFTNIGSFRPAPGRNFVVSYNLHF